MITLHTKIAVQNQTTPSSIALLDNVMDGVEGAVRFGYSVEEQTIRIGDNQTMQHLHDHTFEIVAIEETAQSAILDGIVNNQRLAKLSAHGPDGFLLWDTPSLVLRNKKFDGILASAVKSTLRSTIGYRGVAPNRKLPVYAGDNLLGVYDVTTGESQGGLNGFTDANGADLNTTLDEMTIRVGGAVTNTVFARSANLLFPFVGVQLTASLDVISMATGDLAFGFEFVQADGSTIVSTSVNDSITLQDTPGRFAHNATVPANTVYVRFVIGSGPTAPGASDDYIVSKPMIGLNGKTNFVL